MANQQPNNNFRTSKLIQEILVGLRDDKTENVVDLSNGLLNDDDVKRMCVFLPRNVTMDSLIARHNNLTYKSGQAFAQALATRHAHIEELDLSFNSIRMEGIISLSEALEWNTSILTLNLRRNELTNDGESVEGIVKLARALEKNYGMTDLDLSDNNLTDYLGKMEGVAALAAMLEKNETLKILKIPNNVLGSQGAALLSDCIVSNTALTSLNLASNSLGSKGAKSIASILSRGSLKNIKELNLAHNDLCGQYGNIEDNEVKILANSLKGHETLTNLNLIDNGVTVAAGQVFVDALRYNTSLLELKIGGSDPVQGSDKVMESLRLCLESNQTISKIINGEIDDVNMQDNKLRSPLHHAVEARSIAGIAKLIDDLDAEKDVQDARRCTPLRRSVEMRFAPTIAALLSRDVNINLTDKFGDSPLHQAVRDGDGALATVLLDQGADTSILNNRGLRPLDVTRSQHLRELLLKHARRRPIWLIVGHDDLELEFGERLAKEIWDRSGLMSWIGGGEGRDGWKHDDSYMTKNTVDGDNEDGKNTKKKKKKTGTGKKNSQQEFAGYEGSTDKLMEDMIGHCAIVVFIAGPYSQRSPACLRELMVAVDKNIPIINAQYHSAPLPRSLEGYLYKKKMFSFTKITEAMTKSRRAHAWDDVAPEFVKLMHVYEDEFRKQLPIKMMPMIGSDADHFALKQVDGKCYVFISHGGAHRQYATHVKHELEQYRLWCFVDNNDKRAAEDRLTLAQEGLNKCMVFVPILSDDSLKNPILVEQIKLAEKTGKPLFPIVLSQMKIPPMLHSPCTLLTRRSIVTHIHPSLNKDKFSGIGRVHFRGNYESLAVWIQSQIAMGVIHSNAGVLTMEDEEDSKNDGDDLFDNLGSPFEAKSKKKSKKSVGSHGSNFGGGAKDGARYRQLQERIRGQDQALVESFDRIKALEKELKMANKKIAKSGLIVKELATCVEFYRSKLPRYQKEEIEIESSIGEEDAETLKEKALYLHRMDPAVQIQRMVRGMITREKVYQIKLLKSAIYVQSRYRGYIVRRKMWEE